MLVSLCIIAMNEANSIGKLISSISAQSIFAQPYDFEIVVVSNGCTDNTATVAQTALEEAFGDSKVAFRVHDTPEGGKARSWNLAVHDILNPNAETIVFMDADIEIIDHEVIDDIVSTLSSSFNLSAVSGWPVKDIALKARKSVADYISLKISSQTPAPHSLNGSLYAGRAGDLRKIWLPV
ncbi:MAG: glycosyltransferase, partial [Sphingorhabdus sp.]